MPIGEGHFFPGRMTAGVFGKPKSPRDGLNNRT